MAASGIGALCTAHPNANDSYWRPKLDTNTARGRRNDQALADASWTVLRFWAHQAVDDMAQEVVAALTRST